MIDSCGLAALAGVLVGVAIAGGLPMRAVAKAIGHGRLAYLIQLLERAEKRRDIDQAGGGEGDL